MASDVVSQTSIRPAAARDIAAAADMALVEAPLHRSAVHFTQVKSGSAQAMLVRASSLQPAATTWPLEASWWALAHSFTAAAHVVSL